MKLFLVLVPVLACATLSTFDSGAHPSVPGGVDNYKIDGVHSTVLFKVRHLGVSEFWGRFNKIGGTIFFDPDKPEASSLKVKIDANSIDSGDGGRDKHLKNPQFFNVKQHADITFESKKFTATGEGTFKVSGDFTLLGETKSITVEARYLGKKDTGSSRFGTRAGFVATFKFKRSDFGMKYMVKGGMLGDEVLVVVNLEAVLLK